MVRFYFSGVQSYVVEGRVSCSINWFSRRKRDINYNIVIFFTTFLLPACIILVCNLRVLHMVRQKSFRGSSDKVSVSLNTVPYPGRSNFIKKEVSPIMSLEQSSKVHFSYIYLGLCPL